MVAGRTQHIAPFLAMEVLERAQEIERGGAGVIHLEVGEPDLPTPQPIVEAATRAITDGRTKYTHSLGLRPLREAIADHYESTYRVRVSPDQILVTAGSSPALLLLCLTLLEPGDEVILTDPCYACYPNFVRFAGGVPVFVRITEEGGFQLTAEAVRRAVTPRTRAVVINSPANPTGAVLDPLHLADIAELGVWVISDEIYHGLTYAGRDHSILECTDRAFVLNGFSKAYAMTGWRLGYAIAPPGFVRSLQTLHQNFFISANEFVQWAGIAALRECTQDVARMRAVFDERRCFLVPRLREMGFGVAVEPTGAFYVLANAKRFCTKSYDFAFDILEHARVGLAPGIDFGDGGEGYLRFSYANSMENLAEALARIQRFLESGGGRR
ncbi:MAG: pyridoxal phosphate-dependent aminotransferase [Armatimonadetes bacterium]|nr:pyridoxal phosphate-dependent aminotransferase [Armatimonadota bacterium]